MAARFEHWQDVGRFAAESRGQRLQVNAQRRLKNGVHGGLRVGAVNNIVRKLCQKHSYILDINFMGRILWKEI